MKFLLSTLLFSAAFSSATFFQDAFNQWMRRHSISYETGLEKRYRFAMFAENYANAMEEFLASPVADVLTIDKYECMDDDEWSTFCFIR